MSNENIYSAPQSNVVGVVDKTDEVEAFPRFSAWAVFFLGIPTMGLYNAYWLYSRSKIMNRLSNHSLSTTIPMIYLGIATASFVMSILNSVVFKGSSTIAMVSGVVSLVNFVLYLITAFSLRRELEKVLESSGSSAPSLGGIMVFFFSSIYMQYKINQCIDDRNNSTERETIFSN